MHRPSRRVPRARRLRGVVVAAGWSLLAACGGGDAAPSGGGATAAAPTAAAPTAAKKPGGFDLGDLRAVAESAPAAATSAAAPAPAAAPTAAAPAPAAGATPKATAAAPAAPEADVPVTLADISDAEVLAAYAEDEREALAEMPEEERAGLMAAKRREIFLARGGTLLRDSGKMEEQAVDEATGMRGPARPEAPRTDGPPPDLQAVLAALASPEPEDRAIGADMATRYPDRAVAAKHVAPLLKDRDPEVRAVAASTLGAIGRVEAIPELVKVLDAEMKDAVRTAALRAIGQIGGADGTAALRGIVRTGSEPGDRAAALGMLADRKDPALVRDLVGDAMKDLSGEVRLAAVSTIRTFALKEWERDLGGLLGDASDMVIVETIRALGEFKARSAVGGLVRCLVRPHPESENPESIQDAAALALRTITGEDFGYEKARTDGEREAAIQEWGSWWDKNKADWK